MKPHLLLFAMVALVGSAEAEPSRPKIDINGPAKLVPGTSIGPFRLGMTRADIVKLGVAMKTPATSIIATGPYEIALDRDDHVVSISRRMAVDQDGRALRGGVILAGKTIDPEISFAALAKRIPGCEAAEALIGGTVAKCADHTFVVAAGPVGVVEIKIER